MIVHHCRFLAKTGSNRINRHWYLGFHCQFISLSVLAKNRQWYWVITAVLSKNRHWYYLCRFVAWTDSDMLQENFISFSYDVRLRWTLYQSCSTRRDLQLCSLNFFNLRSFGCPNIFIWNNYVWFLKLEFEFFKRPQTKKRPKQKL